MSTDKTLADVQPGGRVRLGDAPWPEIDVILADAYSAGAEGLPFEGIARRAAVRNAIAALSAHPSPATCKEGLQVQPSPGGQGDELPALPYPNYPVSKTGLQNNAYTASQMQDYARAALAARQPVELIAQKVGDYRVTVAEDAITVSRGRDIVFAYSAGAPEPINARQPVGVPVAWMARPVLQSARSRSSVFCSDSNLASQWDYSGHPEYGRMTVTPLYAAPTAQAVDLGKLPRAVELLSNVARTLVDWAADEQREAIGIVKALIDSQAVGK